MTNSFFRIFIFIFILVISICIFFMPFFLPNSIGNTSYPTYEITTDGFMWPLPGYTRISSYF